jgi:ABC-type nitrate/sulfonate/bicarbonate transport system substrate-binding protein
MAICLLVMVSEHWRHGSQPEKLNAGYSIYSGMTAPLWTTKEASLFEKNGLNVQLIFLKGGTEAAQALITGDIPFAMTGGSGVISSNLAGSGTMILAGLENEILFKFVTAREITSPDKLRGQKLGVASLGGSTYLATLRALQQFALKPSDVTILAIGNAPTRLTAVQSGSIQGAVFLPPETLVAKKLGLNILLDLGSLGRNFRTRPSPPAETSSRKSRTWPDVSSRRWSKEYKSIRPTKSLA